MGLHERTHHELVVPITVEFEDVDSYRIAHHTKLVAYLERARLRLLSAFGFDLEGNCKGVAPVLYDLQMRFRKPARLLDQLEVTVIIRDHDDYQIAMDYRIRRGEDTLVKATSIIAFADLERGSITTMPPALTEALLRNDPQIEGHV